jgi:acyl-CoA reductase-like NAD-dependent aldehyde dehydrogenase
VEAFPGCATSGIQARADALEKVAAELLARRAELGDLLACEEGETLPEAVAEVQRAGEGRLDPPRSRLRERGPAADPPTH